MIPFGLGFLLAAILAIIKEHADRQEDVKTLRFVPADKPGQVKEVAANKSWWEQIQEQMKMIGLVLLGAILAWVAIRVLAGG